MHTKQEITKITSVAEKRLLLLLIDLKVQYKGEVELSRRSATCKFPSKIEKLRGKRFKSMDDTMGVDEDSSSTFFSIIHKN